MLGLGTWMVWIVVAWAALAGLALAAIVSIARSAGLPSTAKAVWIALVVVVPLFGAAAWFVYRAIEPGSQQALQP